MASEAAKAVAEEVIKSLGKSRRPVLRKIAVEKGYSQETADTPKNITETKSYKSVIEPFTNRLMKHREMILSRMEETVNEAEYSDLSASLDRSTKVIQLLTGGATQNIAIGVKKLSDDELTQLADGKPAGS